jgi:peroxiredoxin
MAIRILETTNELNAARDHYRNEVISADKLKIMDSATDALVRSALRKDALRKGDRVQDFILMDTHGNPTRLQQLLSRGPVVIAFYRGGWCPYCNIELRGLQRVLPQIQKLGASLVAISPQLPDHSLSTKVKNHLEFPVLSDVGNTMARRFGIVFRLPADLLATYEALQHGLATINGKNGATELPVPATFVLNRHGVIQLAYVDEDYTRRLDPEVVLDKLRQISNRR